MIKLHVSYSVSRNWIDERNYNLSGICNFLRKGIAVKMVIVGFSVENCL